MTDFSKQQGRRCACSNLRKASRALTRYYDRSLSGSGLKVTQYSLLMSIARNRGISVTELADLAVMDQTTVTRNLEGLRRAGLVEIAREGRDARRRLVSITPRADETLARAMPLWERAQSAIERGLGEEGFGQLVDALLRVTRLVR